jgi:hypothetical protein
MASTVGSLGACGLGLQGLQQGTLDGAPGGEDGSTDGPLDSGDQPDSTPPGDSGSGPDSAMSVPETGPVDTGLPCTTVSGCYFIPPGWQLIAVAADRSTGCPAGFAAAQPTDLDEGPDVSNACTCTCAITEDPTCPTGPIAVAFDTIGSPGAGLCGQSGNPIANVLPGDCNTDLYYPASSYPTLDLQYTPAAATGGQCSAVGTGNSNVTYATEGRACVPDDPQSAGCNGDQCTPDLAAPYRPCIVQSGVQTCPGGPFTEQHRVGSGVSFACSDCGCSVTATCVGTMKLFVDSTCMQQELDIPADGQCHDPAAPSEMYDSYLYVPGTLADECTTTPSTAQNMALQNEETVCCVP